MTWTRRRWLTSFALATLAAALRPRRAAAAPAKEPEARVEYKTRWIGHF